MHSHDSRAEPRVLPPDEPFAVLDSELRERLVARIQVPQPMIIHDTEDLARFGETRMQLRGGQVVVAQH